MVLVLTPCTHLALSCHLWPCESIPG